MDFPGRRETLKNVQIKIKQLEEEIETYFDEDGELGDSYNGYVSLETLRSEYDNDRYNNSYFGNQELDDSLQTVCALLRQVAILYERQVVLSIPDCDN